MAETISTLNMTKEEWLKKRHESIGASDAGCLMGVNPWKSNVDLYLEKVNPTLNNETNMAMRLGTKMEPIIKELLAEDHGFKIRNDNKIRIHPKHKFITTNLDGVVIGEKVPIEYKTTANWDGEISDQYFMQLQHQMMVTDAPYCYFAVLSLGYNKQLVVEKYERHNEIIEELLEKECKFWEENVLKQVMPHPLDPKDISRVYANSTPEKTIKANSELVNKITELKLMQSERKAHQHRERILKSEIQHHMEDAEYMVYEEGTPLVSWKQSKPTNKFNMNKFKEECGEEYAKYLTETPGLRKFLLKIK